MSDGTEGRSVGRLRLGMGYVVAMLVTALAALLSWWLPEVLEPIPYLAFYPAVVAAAAFGGMGPGLLAVVVSALCVELLFDTTPARIAWTDPMAMGHLAMFLVGGVGVSAIAYMLRRAVARESRRREELRDSQQMLRNILDHFPGVVFWKDRDSVYLGCNKAFAHGAGLAGPDAIIGKTDYELPWAHSEATAYRADDWVVMDSGTPKLGIVETQVQADGRVVWFETNKLPLLDAAGKVIGVFGTANDITERKRAEGQLAEQNRFLNTVLESLTHPFYVIDARDHTIKVANSAARRLGEPGPAATCHALTHHSEEPCCLTGHTCPLEEVKATGKPTTAEHIHHDQEGNARAYEIHAYPIFDDSGEVAQMIEYSLDITQRKRAEERLAKLNACWLAFGADADQNINRLVALCGETLGAACALYNRLDGGRLHALGQWNVPSDFVAVDQPEGHICYDVIRGGRDEVVSIRDLPSTPYAHSDPSVARYGLRSYFGKAVQVGGVMVGSLCVVYMEDRVLDEQEQALLSMSASAIKVEEERKRVQWALAAAKGAAEDASRAKGHFIAVLSHELRNPLNPVLATVTMLQRDHHFDADISEQLEVIRRNAELEARLIDDLLDITRIERGKVELERQCVELGTIIHRAAEVCLPDIEARKLEFGIDAPDGPYPVDADAARLQQVFWNLIKNSIKFTPMGGCVGVRCRRDGDTHVIAEVNDSGQGIAPEMLPRLFTAFEQGERHITRRFGGLGLGLAISKTLVELHGGTLTASSEGLDRGATFTVRLPLLAAEAGGPAAPLRPAASARASPARSLRILLVEDHGDTARIMKRLLMADGHEVQTAADVATALQLAQSQRFDLLLSDLGLPDGSGVDLMRTIRQNGSKLPGIALSGYGQEQDVQQSRDAGFMAHLTKPVDVHRLARTIDRVVNAGAGKSLNPDQ